MFSNNFYPYVDFPLYQLVSSNVSVFLPVRVCVCACVYNVVICLVHLVTHMGCFVLQILLHGSVNALSDPLDQYFTTQ